MTESIIDLEAGVSLVDYINKHKHVIVDFYADWSGECRKITPLLEKHIKTYPNVIVVKVNVDDHEELATEFKVTGIPYVLYFNNGKKADEFTGLDEAALKRMFEKTN